MSDKIVHADDILLIGNLAERTYHRHFPERQTISTNMSPRESIRGRRIRTVWYTDLSSRGAYAADVILALDESREPFVLRPVDEWESEPPSVIAKLKALTPPSKNAHHCAGYRKAINDAIELLAEELSA